MPYLTREREGEGVAERVKNTTASSVGSNSDPVSHESPQAAHIRSAALLRDVWGMRTGRGGGSRGVQNTTNCNKGGSSVKTRGNSSEKARENPLLMAEEAAGLWAYMILL